MKKFTLATVTILAISLSLVFAAAKPNFTGTWVMDKNRSEGQRSGIVSIFINFER